MRIFGLGCASVLVLSIGAARLQADGTALNLDRPASRMAIAGLLSYPKDVRDAALELSQYPDLVIQLRYSGDPAAMDKLIAHYPATAQSAARVIAGQGDALATVQRHLLSLSTLGKTYATQPDAVRAIVDRMSEQTHQETHMSTKQWGKRLEKNPAAAQEFLNVGDELAKTKGTANFTKTDLPTPDQVDYTLVHSDRFPALAGEIIDQWENEKNPEQFRQSVDLWYAQRRDSLPEHFGSDAAFRTKVLKEQVLFDSKYAAALQSAQTLPPSRLEFLQQNEAVFPSLVEVQNMKAYAIASAKPVRVAGGPWTGGTGNGTGSSSSSSSSGRSGSSSSRGGNTFNMSSSSSSGGGLVGTNNRRNSRNGTGNNRSNRNNGSGSSGGFGNGGGFGSGGGGFGSGGGGFGSGGSGFGSGGSGFGSGGFGGSNRSNSSNR